MKDSGAGRRPPLRGEITDGEPHPATMPKGFFLGAHPAPAFGGRRKNPMKRIAAVRSPVISRASGGAPP